MIGLLQRDPTRRLGANGGEEIKRHPFFAKYVDWNRHVPYFSAIRTSLMNSTRLLHKKIQPPFKPSVVSSP
jgi:serum/glucocorticoid-regulated kinase 2